MGDVLANRSSDNETKSIESKSMAMTFTRAAPDGNDHFPTVLPLSLSTRMSYR